MNNTEYPIAVEIKNSDDLNIDFQQYWFALKRRFVPAIGVAGGFFALSCMGLIILPKSHYLAEVKILVKPDESATLTGLLTDNKNQLTPLTLQGNPLKTETEIILSQPVISKVIDSSTSFEKNGKKISEDEVRRNLQVQEIRGTDILEISYKSTDPKLAAFVVNEIMKAYINNNKLVNRSEALTAKNFIAQQLPETQESVRQAEKVLRKFKEKNELVAIDQEAKLSLETAERLKSQIAESRANLFEVSAKYRDLIQKLGMDSQKAIFVAKLSQSTSVQRTLRDIQKTEQDLKIARVRFQNNNPKILNLRDEVITLNKQLQQQILEEIGESTIITKQDLQAGELELNLNGTLVKLKVSGCKDLKIREIK
ncbi:MAG: hypothetical protein MJK14_10945 [Rivularia sp. ALOHA_DT_140]|nr:hypothetical protein [Rivularia sp. ALOHA_DT_140]